MAGIASYWLAAIAAMAAMWWWSRRCRRLRRRRAETVAALDAQRDMHAIVTHAADVDFPLLVRTSLEYALLRTYGIPSISRLLSRTAQFRAAPAKRYDDTLLLVEELYLQHVDGARGSAAVRRLNHLHSLYYPSIRDADFLYILCLFIVYPPRWCSLYGYREWTEKEKQAHYGSWHDIGVRMGIRGIPASVDAAAEYLDRFEAREMAYADSNREIAEYTIALFLGDLPRLLRPLARRLLYAMMDDPLLAAMGYPKQPRWLSAILKLGLRASQRVFTRWFLPPRPLEKATFRIWKPGCPALPGKMPVGPPRFRSAPCVYADTGYRIDELGPLHPGKLAPPAAAVDGEHQPLFCPLEACSQLPWPQSLFPRLSS